MEKVWELLGGYARNSLAASYEQAIGEATAAGDLGQNPIWTQSIAVGGEAFVSTIETQTRNRVELTKEEVGGGSAGGAVALRLILSRKTRL